MSRYPFKHFAATPRITDCEPAPDGACIYYVSDEDGQFNLWRRPTAGGHSEQLTRFTAESVRAVLIAPDHARIAFTADVSGNELAQIYLMDVPSGAVERLTQQPQVQHVLEAFSPDGRYLVYSANAAAPEHVDLFLRDLSTDETRQLTQGDRIMYGARFSPDGTRLLAGQHISHTHQNLWLFDLATGESTNLTEADGREAKRWPGPLRADSKGFWFLGNDAREFMALGYCDLDTGEMSPVIIADWDVEQVAVSAKQKLMAYCMNEAGNSRLQVIDLVTGRELDLPEMPKGVMSQLRFAAHDERRRLFLSMNCYNRPAAVYLLDLDTRRLQVLTPSEIENLPAEGFAEPELIYIDAFDGQSIPAWLYRPRGVSPGQKVPAVLSIHGGPEIQERTDYRYNGFYQCLLSQGIAVLAPNIRGSTGFGVSWQKQVHRDWGGGDLKDMEACAKHLTSLEWIDSTRLAVWGRSYGGFASLSCAARLPEYWACAVDFCGPSNLVTFASSVPPTWRSQIRDWIGDPEDDCELLTERSPITYVQQIRCPLLVLQGARDPRVVKAESDQLVERLRELNRPVEYLVFEDEGHNLTKPVNQVRGYQTMVDFLVRHLKG